MIKVGNTSFQEEVIKKMTLKQFKGTYGGILKGQDLDSVYSKVTGKPKKQSNLARREYPADQRGEI